MVNEKGAILAKHFLKEVLQVRTWSKTEEIIDAVFSPAQITVVRSCTGAGKTKGAADIAIAWLMTAPNRTVITTAPTFRQVNELLWKEIRKSIKSCQARGIDLGGKLPDSKTRYQIDDGWLMLGFTSNDDVSFQGWHSEGGTLVVIDEAVGVDEKTWEALEATLTGADDRLLALANPTKSSGRFFELNKTTSGNAVKRIHISAFDVPNVSGKEAPINGLTTKQFIENKRTTWGEDSVLWKTRILGEFPKEDEFALVPLSWVDAAVERWNAFNPHLEHRVMDVVAGLDVARLGVDNTILAPVFYFHDGIRVDEFLKLPKSELMATARKAIEYGKSIGVSQMRIDADGIGAGVFDRAKELCDFAVEYRGGRSAKDNLHFFNLRSEAMWNVREMLNPENKMQLMIPPDDALAFQLTSMRWMERSDGRIQIESKDEWRKRTGKSSPDELDALGMALARGIDGDHSLWSKAYG
jgi:hypothetical protein